MNDDIDELVNFLQELCKGEALRSVICDVIVQECLEETHSRRDLTRVNSETSCSSDDFNVALCRQNRSKCCENEPVRYLDLLLDIIIKLDFPENLVTFLLQLLPNQKYKVCNKLTIVLNTY